MTSHHKQHNDIRTIVQDLQNLTAFHGGLDLDYPQTDGLTRLLSHKTPLAQNSQDKQNPAEPSPKIVSKQQSSPQKVPKKTVPAVSETDIDNCREAISLCASCPHRKPPKFGVGSNDHPFIFIICDKNSSDPSRPMEEEEESLLGKMLGAIKIKPSQIFVTNIVKCQTESSGQAHLKEMAGNCLSHTRQQIRLMQPSMICTMGQLSSQTVLSTTNQLMALRGHFHQFMDIPLMATYHPSQLLSVPELKKAAWYDLQLMQRKLATGDNT